MMRNLILAATAALTLGASMAHAYGGTFQCENQMDMDGDEARAISGNNNALFNIVVKYRELWDIAYMRGQCEAFAEGEPFEISCLNDRRNWDEIKAMVPSEYFGMSSPDLTPRFHELQTNGVRFREVFDYCRSVGAVK